MRAMYALRSPVMRATLVRSSPSVRFVRFPPCAHSQKIAPALPRTITQTTARPAARRRWVRVAATAPAARLVIATSVMAAIAPVQSGYRLRGRTDLPISYLDGCLCDSSADGGHSSHPHAPGRRPLDRGPAGPAAPHHRDRLGRADVDPLGASDAERGE